MEHAVLRPGSAEARAGFWRGSGRAAHHTARRRRDVRRQDFDCYLGHGCEDATVGLCHLLGALLHAQPEPKDPYGAQRTRRESFGYEGLLAAILAKVGRGAPWRYPNRAASHLPQTEPRARIGRVCSTLRSTWLRARCNPSFLRAARSPRQILRRRRDHSQGLREH